MSEKASIDILLNGECRMLQELLEDGVLDGPRPDREQQKFIERHLADCPGCAAFAGLIERMPVLAPTVLPEESRAAAAAAGKTHFRRRRRMLIGGASIVAVAACSLLALNLYSMIPARPLDDATVTLEPVRGGVGPGETTNAPQTPVALALGRPITADEYGIRLPAGDRVTIALEAGASIEPLILERNEVEIRLYSGLLAVEVEPIPTRSVRFVVHTPAGTVAVRGTVFGVEVADDGARVDVVRGEVAVRTAGHSDPETIAVAAGRSFDLAMRRESGIDTRTGDRILELLGLTASRAPAIDLSPRERTVPVEGTVPAAAQDRSGVADRKPSKPDAEELFRAARACRADLDWNCAADRYRDILNFYPNRSEALTALVLLAKLQLRHLGRPKEALGNFRRYRERSPTGALAEESLYGICRALKALDRAGEEKKALEEFLQIHPSSPLTPKVRNRLGKISE